MRLRPLTGHWPFLIIAVGLGVVLSQGCASSVRQVDQFPHYPVGFVERGVASWYGPGFHGNKTANGERYDMYALTAAHQTLPLGSVAVVYSLTSSRHVTVRINDRGPFVPGRIIDLDKVAFAEIASIGAGVINVKMEEIVN